MLAVIFEVFLRHPGGMQSSLLGDRANQRDDNAKRHQNNQNALQERSTSFPGQDLEGTKVADRERLLPQWVQQEDNGNWMDMQAKNNLTGWSVISKQLQEIPIPIHFNLAD